MADDRDPGSSSESSRRAFIQRMLAAGFAAPVIGSFSFSELASASEQRHTFPCQYHPNQPPPKCDNDDDDQDDHCGANPLRAGLAQTLLAVFVGVSQRDTERSSAGSP